jgi:hypothetical protein
MESYQCLLELIGFAASWSFGDAQVIPVDILDGKLQFSARQQVIVVEKSPSSHPLKPVPTTQQHWTDR